MNHREGLILPIGCLPLAFLSTMIWIQQQDESMATKVSSEILRFHVLANSNSNEDQKLKLEVKSLLIDTINGGLPADARKEETCTYTKRHQSDLEQTAETYMEQAGYDYPVAVALINCCFPTKAYGDVVLSYGNYDAAEVVIGNERGQNWWCVLYLQLHFVSASYRVVPEASKKLLRDVLTQEEYSATPDNRSERLQVEVHFKMLDVMKDITERK